MLCAANLYIEKPHCYYTSRSFVSPRNVHQGAGAEVCPGRCSRVSVSRESGASEPSGDRAAVEVHHSQKGHLMPSIGLSVLDWLIIAIYFGFILGLGYYLKRYTKSQEDYFLAGRKNSAWVAGLAFLSANLGALELLGMTGNTFKYGMYVAHFYWIGAIPAMLFLGLYMMPFYYSSRIHSVPGYLKLRFDEKTRVLNGIAFAVMTLLVSGINLYAMALVLRTFLGWDWNVSMWVSAVTVACYVTLSGLMSAIFTEIIQFFLIWFGLVPRLDPRHRRDRRRARDSPARAARRSGRSGRRRAIASQNGMVITWAGIVLGLGFVLSFGYWTTDFLVVQRAFSAKDLRSARMTPIIASFFKMAVAVHRGR